MCIACVLVDFGVYEIFLVPHYAQHYQIQLLLILFFIICFTEAFLNFLELQYLLYSFPFLFSSEMLHFQFSTEPLKVTSGNQVPCHFVTSGLYSRRSGKSPFFFENFTFANTLSFVDGGDRSTTVYFIPGGNIAFPMAC